MLPGGEVLEQSDGTAWMAKFCLNMLEMALRLANHDRSYEDVALKFFEHFAVDRRRDERALGRAGRLLLRPPAHARRLDPCRCARARWSGCCRSSRRWSSTRRCGSGCRDFRGARRWFIEQQAAARRASCATSREDDRPELIALVGRAAAAARARAHARRGGVPVALRAALAVALPPRASARRRAATAARRASTTSRRSRASGLFGGNSNWRGPIWFPLNFLALESLRHLHALPRRRASRSSCRPARACRRTSAQVADELERRLLRLFLLDAQRPPPGVRRQSRCSSAIRPGATTSCSTSTSTATPAKDSARRTRPAGRRSRRR